MHHPLRGQVVLAKICRPPADLKHLLHQHQQTENQDNPQASLPQKPPERRPSGEGSHTLIARFLRRRASGNVER
jgi:hypothetical protein